MNHPNDASAVAIYQDLLDRIAHAMETRDYAQYQHYFAVPHVVETFEGRKEIADDRALRQFFDTLCAKLDNAGNSRMIRYCKAASFQDDTTIHGSHETRVVGHGHQIGAAYPAYSVLKLSGGQWRVASSQYAQAQGSFVDDVLRRFDR